MHGRPGTRWQTTAWGLGLDAWTWTPGRRWRRWWVTTLHMRHLHCRVVPGAWAVARIRTDDGAWLATSRTQHNNTAFTRRGRRQGQQQEAGRHETHGTAHGRTRTRNHIVNTRARGKKPTTRGTSKHTQSRHHRKASRFYKHAGCLRPRATPMASVARRIGGAMAGINAASTRRASTANR